MRVTFVGLQRTDLSESDEMKIVIEKQEFDMKKDNELHLPFPIRGHEK